MENTEIESTICNVWIFMRDGNVIDLIRYGDSPKEISKQISDIINVAISEGRSFESFHSLGNSQVLRLSEILNIKVREKL